MSLHDVLNKLTKIWPFDTATSGHIFIPHTVMTVHTLMVYDSCFQALCVVSSYYGGDSVLSLWIAITVLINVVS